MLALRSYNFVSKKKIWPWNFIHFLILLVSLNVPNFQLGIWFGTVILPFVVIKFCLLSNGGLVPNIEFVRSHVPKTKCFKMFTGALYIFWKLAYLKILSILKMGLWRKLRANSENFGVILRKYQVIFCFQAVTKLNYWNSGGV